MSFRRMYLQEQPEILTIIQKTCVTDIKIKQNKTYIQLEKLKQVIFSLFIQFTFVEEETNNCITEQSSDSIHTHTHTNPDRWNIYIKHKATKPLKHNISKYFDNIEAHETKTRSSKRKEKTNFISNILKHFRYGKHTLQIKLKENFFGENHQSHQT